jgi:hypothetical protein
MAKTECLRCKLKFGLKCDLIKRFPCRECSEKKTLCIPKQHRTGVNPSRQGKQFRFKNIVKTIVDGNRFRTELRDQTAAVGRVCFEKNGLNPNLGLKNILAAWDKLFPNQGNEIPKFTMHPYAMKYHHHHQNEQCTSALLDKVEFNPKKLLEDIDVDSARCDLDIGDLNSSEAQKAILRFRLPSSEFLDALHFSVAHHYANTGKTRLFGKCNGLSLLALGILIQELIRNELQNGEERYLTTEQTVTLAPNLVDVFDQSVYEDPYPSWVSEPFTLPRDSRLFNSNDTKN